MDITRLSRKKKIMLYTYLLAGFAVITLIGIWRSYRELQKAEKHVNVMGRLSTEQEADEYLSLYYDWAVGDAMKDGEQLTVFMDETTEKFYGQLALTGIVALIIVALQILRIREKKIEAGKDSQIISESD